jgi:hypothetical protein
MWFEIIKFLAEIFPKLKEIGTKEKEKISKTLLEISEIINKVAEDLKSDIYPHSACATMDILSSRLTEMLKGKINESTIQELDLMLKKASRLEEEYSRRAEPDTIPTLQVISGKFQGFSIYFNV